ncbi:MAG: 2-hydroxyacid dehydrogenase [Pseudomonadota bacterium]
MEKPQVLVIGPITDRMRDRLDSAFDVTELFEQSDQDAFLREHGGDFVAVSTDGHYGLNPAPVEHLPNLKVVSSYGVGYDGINAVGLAERGVLVAHTPDVLNDEVADTAILLWLAASKGLVAADGWARSGKWEAEGGFPLMRSVQGRRVGILGMGRIGQTIARRAEAFGAEVLYTARAEKDLPYRFCATPVELAREAEVLIVITPGGAGTRHLVNREVMDALGPEGLLVNVARGSVVDEAALVEALQDGRLGGAALDVFEAEPKIPDALKAMDHVVLAPHIGSATVETRAAMGDLTVDNLLQFLADGTVKTPVPECRALNG